MRGRSRASLYLSSRLFSRRMRSIALRFAVIVIQARGFGGTPSVGHRSTAVANASAAASSAISRSPNRLVRSFLYVLRDLFAMKATCRRSKRRRHPGSGCSAPLDGLIFVLLFVNTGETNDADVTTASFARLAAPGERAAVLELPRGDGAVVRFSPAHRCRRRYSGLCRSGRGTADRRPSTRSSCCAAREPRPRHP